MSCFYYTTLELNQGAISLPNGNNTIFCMFPNKLKDSDARFLWQLDCKYDSNKDFRTCTQINFDEKVGKKECFTKLMECLVSKQNDAVFREAENRFNDPDCSSQDVHPYTHDLKRKK